MLVVRETLKSFATVRYAASMHILRSKYLAIPLDPVSGLIAFKCCCTVSLVKGGRELRVIRASPGRVFTKVGSSFGSAADVWQGAYGPCSENLEKYLNFEKRFQGVEKALKIGENKKILEKTLNFGVTSLTFVESKILVLRIEAVCRKSLAKSWDRSTSGLGAGSDAKADGMRGRVGVDPRLRTSIVRRLNLHHGLAPAIGGFELTIRMTRRA